jgi:hypothetical protein
MYLTTDFDGFFIWLEVTSDCGPFVPVFLRGLLGSCFKFNVERKEFTARFVVVIVLHCSSKF